MRAAVNTQTKITMFFRVGRCVIRDETRDGRAASEPFVASASPPTTDEDDVEFNCVAGEERVRGSPLTRQRAAMIKVKASLYDTMVLEEDDARRDALSVVSPNLMKCDSSCHIIENPSYQWQIRLFAQ